MALGDPVRSVLKINQEMAPMVKQVLRKQAFLAGLIVLISLVFFLQGVVGYARYSPFMVVPQEVVAAWNSLCQGTVTTENFRTLGTLLSSAFLHGNTEHLFYNMLYLWIFGALTTELIGPRWMLAIFLVTAVSGSVLHTVLNSAERVPMLGASGAVMGFEGVYLGLALRWRLPDPHVWPMAHPIPPGQLAALAVIGVVLDFYGIMNHQANIAYGAHIGGFFAGLILAATIIHRPRTAGD